MKVFRYVFLAWIGICTQCFAQTAPHCSQIMDYVEKKLPHCGVLKMTPTFVFVDLDDAYIHSLTPFIEQDGFQEPPYFGDPYTEGAHISIMYSEEVKKYGIKKIAECGEVIHFTPKTCEIVHHSTWKEMEEIYLIVVDAPELDKIRKKYGLPPLNFPFHITIGVKPKKANAA